VITAGENVLLTCSTTEGAAITSWDMPIDLRHKTNVYAAPSFRSDGTTRSPEKLAKGYFVTRPADNETTLHMNKTTLSQAGIYVCTCELPSTAAATVVVFGKHYEHSECRNSLDYLQGNLALFSQTE